MCVNSTAVSCTCSPEKSYDLQQNQEETFSAVHTIELGLPHIISNKKPKCYQVPVVSDEMLCGKLTPILNFKPLGLYTEPDEPDHTYTECVVTSPAARLSRGRHTDQRYFPRLLQLKQMPVLLKLRDNRFELRGAVGLERRWLMGAMRRRRPGHTQSSVPRSPAALAVSVP